MSTRPNLRTQLDLVPINSHFREITATDRSSFEFEQPLVSELTERVPEKYGEYMTAMLIAPVIRDLNLRGTMYVHSKDRRRYARLPAAQFSAV